MAGSSTQSGAKETIADWLALHGLSVDQCVALLPASPDQDYPPLPKPQSFEMDAQDVLTRGCEALVNGFAPGVRTELMENCIEVRILTDAKRIKEMTGTLRAFTLDKDQQGHAVVFCPYRHTSRDAFALMHEIAHGLQYTRATNFVPPALRETFALLGEQALIDALQASDNPLTNAVIEIRDAYRARFASADSAALLAALDEPDTPYDYRWNYAMAHALWPALSAGDQPLARGTEELMSRRLWLADGPAEVGDLSRALEGP